MDPGRCGVASATQTGAMGPRGPSIHFMLELSACTRTESSSSMYKLNISLYRSKL